MSRATRYTSSIAAWNRAASGSGLVDLDHRRIRGDRGPRDAGIDRRRKAAQYQFLQTGGRGRLLDRGQAVDEGVDIGDCRQLDAGRLSVADRGAIDAEQVESQGGEFVVQSARGCLVVMDRRAAQAVIIARNGQLGGAAQQQPPTGCRVERQAPAVPAVCLEQRGQRRAEAVVACRVGVSAGPRQRVGWPAPESLAVTSPVEAERPARSLFGSVLATDAAQDHAARVAAPQCIEHVQRIRLLVAAQRFGQPFG